MKKWQMILRYVLGALFGLCAADGISQVRGLHMMPLWLENTMAALFFAAAFGSVILGQQLRDRKAMARTCIWSGSVVGLMLVLPGLLALVRLTGASEGMVRGLVYAAAAVSAPTVSASVMGLPIVGWALLLVLSATLYRKMRKEDHGAKK